MKIIGQAITPGGGSGGSELVIVNGTIRPTKPTHNMLWLKTDRDITNCVLSATEPGNPTDNEVWLIINNYGENVTFPMGNDWITIHPLSAYQYVNGNWVSVDAMIYLNGEWIELFMYLYNQGNEIEHLTGGWASYATPAVVKNANSIYVEGDSNVRCVIGTSSKIDLRNIDTLYFDVDVTGAGSSNSVEVGVNTKKDASGVASAALGTAGRRIVQIKVTDVSEGYIYCATAGSATCNGYLYKCWGVKN